VDDPTPLFLGLGEQMARVLPLSSHKLPGQPHSNGKGRIFEPLRQCPAAPLSLGAVNAGEEVALAQT